MREEREERVRDEREREKERWGGVNKGKAHSQEEGLSVGNDRVVD